MTPEHCVWDLFYAKANKWTALSLKAPIKIYSTKFYNYTIRKEKLSDARAHIEWHIESILFWKNFILNKDNKNTQIFIKIHKFW